MTKQTTSPVMRLAGIAALVAATFLLVFAGSGSASAQDGTQTEPEGVTESFTPVFSSEPCVPFPVGVTQSAGSTADAFTITIHISRILCDAVGATAAIYAMPSSTTAWPQTLVARLPITMQKSGVQVISFTKTCAPQQFDLIAGTSQSVTPPTIAPTGPWHGPLLFPFDLSTALQWPGCNNPTTTTTTSTTSTTTSTSSTTSTTITPTTQIETTTTVPTTTSSLVTTTVPADVAGETTIAPPPTAQVLGVQQTTANLAFTGVGTKPALFGAVLVAFGLLFMLLGRKPISER